MTTLAIGASVTINLGSDSSCKIFTNGGLASISVTPTGGVTTISGIGPLPVRQTFGPFATGATLVISNQTAALDYSVPGFDPANVAITGGAIAGRSVASVAGAMRTVAQIIPPFSLSVNAVVMTTPPTISYANTAPAGKTVVNFSDARLTYRGVQAGNRNINGNLCFMNVVNGYTGTLPSVTNSATNSPYTLEFDWYGTDFYFMTMGLQSVNQWQLWVDDQPVSAAPLTQGLSAVGGGTWTRVLFGAAGQRRIRIQIGRYIGLKEFYFSSTDALSATTRRKPKIAVLGDSWVEDTGASIDLLGWAEKLQTLTDTEVFICGQGGTGYVNAGPGGQSKGVYGDSSRIAGLAGLNLDYIIVWGSSNDDGSIASAVGAAASSLYATFQALYPNARLIVIGPQSTGSGNTTLIPTARIANAAAIQTAALAAPNVLGFFNPLSDASGTAWITGTGSSTAPSGTGSADIFSNGAVVGHPTDAGHTYVARRVLESLAVALMV